MKPNPFSYPIGKHCSDDRAASYINLGSWDDALADCNESIKLNSENVKVSKITY